MTASLYGSKRGPDSDGKRDIYNADKSLNSYQSQYEIWGTPSIELTNIKDKYTNGEIINNKKYTYKGIG